MKRLLLAAGLIISVSGSQAATVYVQPPGSSGTLYQSSWWNPNGSDYDQYVWDNFTLSSTQAITEIRWRGGYDPAHFGSGGPVIDFTVQIWASIAAGTQPDIGSVFSTNPLVSYQVGGNAGETLAGTFGGVTMYDYSFTLPAAFQAAAGTKYWVQIEAWQNGLPDWGLSAGTGGDGSYFRRIAYVGDIFYQIVSGDAAFTLLTSDAAGFAIAASAFPTNAGSVTGTGTYPDGSTANLVATPSTGFAFVNWTEGGTEVSTSASYSFTVTTNRTLVANFTPAFSITTMASTAVGGSTSGDGSYTNGATATVIATANPGYIFVNWADSGTPVSASTHYSFTVTADRLLVANFILDPFTMLFDFDTGTPTLSPGQGLPLDQTSGWVKGRFSGVFSVQSDATTYFHLSQFQGNYLYPNDIYNRALMISFNQPLHAISLTFATADFQQVETPTTIQVTAFNDSTNLPPVGSATAHGTYAGDTMPMGTITFDAGTQTFNLVEIQIPYAALAACCFLVDNIRVTADTNVPPPSASFTGAPTTGAAPVTVQFTDTSTGAITNRFWDFGDGSTLDAATTLPSHTYTNAGLYTVSLTVWGYGGSNTFTQSNYISVAEPYTQPPTVHIVSPTNGTVVFDRLVNVSGIATDEAAVVSVILSNSLGGAATATLTGTNWTVTNFWLRLGTNTLCVIATDSFTNRATDTITVVRVNTNQVDTTFRTIKATLTLGSAPYTDGVSISGVYNDAGVAFNPTNATVEVMCGDYYAMLPSNSLVKLKFKAPVSPSNTLTSVTLTPKSRTFSFAAGGYTLTNLDPFLVAVSLGSVDLGPDRLAFGTTSNSVGKLSWSYGKQMPQIDQFFLGKSKLTTNTFQLAGNVNILSKPDPRTSPVYFGVGAYGEALSTNGWLQGRGNAYTYTRPTGSGGVVQTMTLDYNKGAWSAKGSGANLGFLLANPTTEIRLEIGAFAASYKAKLIQKGTSFSY